MTSVSEALPSCRSWMSHCSRSASAKAGMSASTLLGGVEFSHELVGPLQLLNQAVPIGLFQFRLLSHRGRCDVVEHVALLVLTPTSGTHYGRTRHRSADFRKARLGVYRRFLFGARQPHLLRKMSMPCGRRRVNQSRHATRRFMRLHASLAVENMQSLWNNIDGRAPPCLRLKTLD
jgi:hypothetical protein